MVGLSTGGLLSEMEMEMAPTLFGRGFTAAYYVGHFCHLPTCAAFKEFAVQHVFSFQAEGGTDQSMDQLVDLGDSLGGTESQGGAEQLAMHCQWQ